MSLRKTKPPGRRTVFGQYGRPCIDPAWGVYNFNTLLGTARTKRLAVKDAEARAGEPWAKCKAYLHVRRVLITTESSYEH